MLFPAPPLGALSRPHLLFSFLAFFKLKKKGTRFQVGKGGGNPAQTLPRPGPPGRGQRAERPPAAGQARPSAAAMLAHQPARHGCGQETAPGSLGRPGHWLTQSSAHRPRDLPGTSCLRQARYGFRSFCVPLSQGFLWRCAEAHLTPGGAGHMGGASPSSCDHHSLNPTPQQAPGVARPSTASQDPATRRASRTGAAQQACTATRAREQTSPARKPPEAQERGVSST